MIEYIGYNGLTNLFEEYYCGRLFSLKYLAAIECHVDGVLLDSHYKDAFESLEELYLEGVHGLEKLCVGELPRRSLCNLKLLNVRNCMELGDTLLPSNLLKTLQNLEILHCEYTEDAGGINRLNYVFDSIQLEAEKIVLAKLREITLCYLVNLRSIWKGPGPYQVFPNLKSLALHGCHMRETYLFPSNVAECLGQLELLWVAECSRLITVIEISLETEISKVLVIPKLKEIYLNSLPKLRRFYSSIWENQVSCPSLEHLCVYGCPELPQLSASDFHSRNQVQLNDQRHFAFIFERLFHRQFNSEEIPQFFSKK